MDSKLVKLLEVYQEAKAENLSLLWKGLESVMKRHFPQKTVNDAIKKIDRQKNKAAAQTLAPAANGKVYKVYVPPTVLTDEKKTSTQISINKQTRVAAHREVPDREIERKETFEQLEAIQKADMYKELLTYTDEEIIEKYVNVKGLREYIKNVFQIPIAGNLGEKKALIIFREEALKRTNVSSNEEEE